MTLRDLARFGLLRLERRHGRRPARRARRRGSRALRARDDELVAAFDRRRRGRPVEPFYHDCWWVLDAAAGVYCGYGINGQRLLVHHPSRTVIAAVSTWPDKMDDRLSRLMDATHEAIVMHLAGG